MAVRVASRFLSGLSTLRYQPTPKRVRVRLAGAPVADTTRAVLVWEPHRVVPQYAVPIGDVLAQLVPEPRGDDVISGDVVSGDVVSGRVEKHVEKHGADGSMVLTPSAGFGVHTSDGDVFTVRTVEHERTGAAFQLHDPDLAGYVVLDFQAFDEWLEEDELIFGHPHDPFKRIDIRQSSRTVRIERDGVVLAESSRPSLLFETYIPVRFYLPLADVRTDLLCPSDTTTVCAYKGVASYWSLPGAAGADDIADIADIAWSYPRPLPDAVPITGMVCFFDERVDVMVDGVRRERAQSPWFTSTRS
jgi:uncharacterized protein (DUF427 family)